MRVDENTARIESRERERERAETPAFQRHSEEGKPGKESRKEWAEK